MLRQMPVWVFEDGQTSNGTRWDNTRWAVGPQPDASRSSTMRTP